MWINIEFGLFLLSIRISVIYQFNFGILKRNHLFILSLLSMGHKIIEA